jgi:hypothetical protein
MGRSARGVSTSAKGEVRCISLDGAAPLRSCNEVEVAKRLRDVRQHAYWFSGYNVARVPEIWRPCPISQC